MRAHVSALFKTLGKLGLGKYVAGAVGRGNPERIIMTDKTPTEFDLELEEKPRGRPRIKPRPHAIPKTVAKPVAEVSAEAVSQAIAEEPVANDEMQQDQISNIDIVPNASVPIAEAQEAEEIQGAAETASPKSGNKRNKKQKKVQATKSNKNGDKRAKKEAGQVTA